jgi:tetratricopeptide (TPR) repeat protein
MMGRLRFLIVLLAAALYLVTAGGSQQAKAKAVSPNETVILKDEPLTVYQSELLDLAFETASLIPVYPHIKDRSRTQEAVATASLELDQPRRALNFIEKIGDWRRGAGYGDLAFYCAQRGYINGAKHYLDLASQISETAEDWRKDVIKVKIAKTYALLGQTQQADELEKDIVESESGKVAAVKAMMAEEGSFYEQLKVLDELVALNNFDILRNALESSTELFNRFYDDKERRLQVEEKIKGSFNSMPVFVRAELLMKLGGFALDHGDKDNGLRLVNEIQALVDKTQWTLEDRIALIAKLTELRFRADDKEKAKNDADAIRDEFVINKNEVINIYRAGALRTLAQAYKTMGETATALEIYKMAVEESIENPNSRPRAEDLSATCISMALSRVEPDDALWSRLRQINQNLADPW